MDEKITLDLQRRLAEIMNDSAHVVKLGGKEYEIRALKPGAQWLIAEESCKIAKAEENNFSDLIKQFAMSKPAVVRCLCIAILNDKAKIEGPEYQALYDTIMWDTNENEWMGVLVEVLQMLDLEGFFRLTSAVEMIRKMALTRKKKAERKQSTHKQNGAK